MWENNTTTCRRKTELVVSYSYIIDITEIIIIIWWNFIGKAGPNCWKMVIKSIRKLTRIRNNGTIHATRSKFVNGLPCFSRITYRLTKSIRIIRCFRSLDVLVYCISQLFVLCPDACIIRSYSFLLAASRSRMPFFNSELIQGAFFILARLVRSGAWKLTTSKNFVFQSAHKTLGSSEPLQVQSCWAISLRKLSRLKFLKFL